MQELEILEEIDKEAEEYMEIDFGDEYNAGIKDMVKMAKKIIRKHMQKEENVLKFYYCESEDDYYIGKRVQNMYYAKYGPGGFTWFMSRYLPWGKHVTAPETAWKEYTYPTEPKEIPFMEWLEGFIRKHMNEGWIPVDDRLPEEHEEGTDIYDKNTLAVMDTEYHMVSNLANVTVYDYENEKYFVGADCTFDGEWCNFGLVTGNYEVIAWRPLPEPYRPERQKEGAQQNES